jgi:hypothetical protein
MENAAEMEGFFPRARFEGLRSPGAKPPKRGGEQCEAFVKIGAFGTIGTSLSMLAFYVCAILR